MKTLPGSYVPTPGGGKANEPEPGSETASFSALMRAAGHGDDSDAVFPEMDVEEPEGPSVEVYTEHTIEMVLDLDVMSLLHPWFVRPDAVCRSHQDTLHIILIASPYSNQLLILSEISTVGSTAVISVIYGARYQPNQVKGQQTSRSDRVLTCVQLSFSKM